MEGDQRGKGQAVAPAGCKTSWPLVEIPTTRHYEAPKRPRRPRQQGRLSFWLYSVCILSASGKNQAAADRYYHQLHLKPWVKSGSSPRRRRPGAEDHGSWPMRWSFLYRIPYRMVYIVWF